MTVFSTGRLPSAGGWAGLVSVHRAFLVKVLLARITPGLVVNILPGSLAEAGSWELSCDRRTQVQSHHQLQSPRHGNRNTQRLHSCDDPCFLTWEGGAASVSLFSVTSLPRDTNCDGECDA